LNELVQQGKITQDDNEELISIFDTLKPNGTNMLVTDKTRAVCNSLPTNEDQQVTFVDSMEGYVCGEAKNVRAIPIPVILWGCAALAVSAFGAWYVNKKLDAIHEKMYGKDAVACTFLEMRCPDDSYYEKRTNSCLCPEGTKWDPDIGKEGECVKPPPPSGVIIKPPGFG
jgi:hypothetical protein